MHFVTLSLALVRVVLSAEPACSADADCTVTTWRCCNCPEQRAVTKAQLKSEEDACAIKKCSTPDCPDPARPVDRSLVAVCQAGKCELSKLPHPPAGKAECAAATDCQVWCCQEDLGAAPKGKKPRPGCKRCPNPQPAAECLDGKCAVAPHALTK